MDDLLRMLAELGFGEYEARAYVSLLEHSPVNGYELARQSGVPRGSIYAALARLEEKGAVVRLEAPEGTRYAPVAAEEVLRRAEDRFQRTLGQLDRKLAEVAAPPGPDYVWSARGYGALLDHARALAESAQERLVIATWPQEAAALSDETAGACARGVQMHTLCLANCPQECGHCRGHVYRFDVVPEREKRWLLLIPDGREVLAGEINRGVAGKGNPAASAVRTRQRLLVGLAESYVRQSTTLAAILAGPGANLAATLASGAREVLASLAGAAAEDDWSERMRPLLAQGSSAREPREAQGRLPDELRRDDDPSIGLAAREAMASTQGR